MMKRAKSGLKYAQNRSQNDYSGPVGQKSHENGYSGSRKDNRASGHQDQGPQTDGAPGQGRSPASQDFTPDLGLDDDSSPVYSSQTPHSSVEIRPHGDYSYEDDDPHSLLTAVYEELLQEEADAHLYEESDSDSLKDNHSRVTATPAVMAHKRDDAGTFPSLDNQDLPIVREYSAGGLIFDDQGRVAIIVRHSRSGHIEWCLPKGHIEKGETPEQTAVREVHEETGILGEVIDSIATIDYWFTGTTQRVHKLVHHYVLRQTGGHLTVEGDPDHEAEDAIWVDFKDLPDVLSYPNERRIVWLYERKNKKAHETDI